MQDGDGFSSSVCGWKTRSGIKDLHVFLERDLNGFVTVIDATHESNLITFSTISPEIYFRREFLFHSQNR